MLRKILIPLCSCLLLLMLCPAALADETGEADTTVNIEEVEEVEEVEEPAAPPANYLFYDRTGRWTYTLIHEYTVRNNSRSVAFNVRVETPLMDNELPAYVYLQGEALSPAAVEIEQDEEGHRTAVYTIDYIPGNKSVTLTQRFIMDVSAMSYVFDRANVADEYTEEEMPGLTAYLAPGEGVHSLDPAITAFTASAVGNHTDPYLKARAIFAAVNTTLTYINDESADQDAGAVLSRRSANCEGYTNLLMSCLRAAGIACRHHSGYLFLPQVHTTAEFVDPVNGRIDLNSLRHSWVEFYLSDVGWIVADPTFTYTYEINGTVQKMVDWSYFANIQPERRYIFFRQGTLNKELINYSYDSVDKQVEVDFNAYLMPGAYWAAFNDIDGHWAQAAVTFCVSNNLFNGVSVNRFAPDQPMTRAMFVTVIGRLYQQLGGEISPELPPASFRDVDNNAYYAPYLSWALINGLVGGYGDGRFGPNDAVTRAQMARLISVFAQFMGENVEIYAGSRPHFTDADSIAAWAATGVVWCANNGIINGLPGNIFSPGTSATRAQVATITQRVAVFLAQQQSPEQ